MSFDDIDLDLDEGQEDNRGEAVETHTADDMFNYILKRLQDTLWRRNNMSKHEGKVYWTFTRLGVLTEQARADLIARLYTVGFGTVIVRTYHEHYGLRNDKAMGIIGFLFISPNVSFPDHQGMVQNVLRGTL